MRSLFCLSFLVFLSCQQQDNEFTQIIFWAMGAEGEAVQHLIPEFERQNTQIRVKVQMFPWTAAQEKLITAYASDNLPDMFQLGNTWIPQFVALDALEILDLFLRQSAAIDSGNYFSGIWNTNKMNGRVYGIPWYVDTRVLFYRTDVLSKVGFSDPPKTWNELYTLSKRIKNEQKDPNKYAIFLPTNEWAQFAIFGLQAGSTLLKDNDTRGNFSGSSFKRAFTFLTQFSLEGLSPLGVSQVTNVYQAFAEEYFVMYISGSWNIPEFKKWMTGSLTDKWSTSALPGPDSWPGVSLAGGASLVLSKKSNHKAESWKLLEYLSTANTQLKFYKLVNDLPAVVKAWDDPVLKEDQYMQAFFNQLHHVVATPKVPEWEQIAFAKIQQYAEIAARGVHAVDNALANLDEDVDRILEKRRWLIEKEANELD